MNYNILEGIKIILQYMPEDRTNKNDFHAEEGSISFGETEWVTNAKDIEKLNELGWIGDPGYSWYINF